MKKSFQQRKTQKAHNFSEEKIIQKKNKDSHSVSTLTSLQSDSQKIIISEATEKLEALKTQRNILQKELKLLKTENKRKINERRRKLELYSEKMEKLTSTLRSQIHDYSRRVKEETIKMENSSNFVEMNKNETFIQETKESFEQCADSILSLAKVLVYDPLTESDFDVILNTGTFDSKIGKLVLELINTAKGLFAENPSDQN